MTIRLSEAEAWAVIEQAHTGILTTLRADGSPVTLPMWFVVRDRTICFLTFAGTKKLARIGNDRRASFLVESGKRWAELRAVHLSGVIDPIEDDESMAAIDAAMDAKYHAFRTARTELPEATAARYTAKRFLRLVPGPRILTWDNARLGLGGGHGDHG